VWAWQVLGSHRVNLSALGLRSPADVAAWAKTQPTFEAAIPAGAVAVLHGATLHRGSPIRLARPPSGVGAAVPPDESRDVMYFT
jgi:hypothetical protein